jgi:predicted PurR-regulated permease PerM
MQTENLKKRILTVCYVLCLLALGWVFLRVLVFIETAVLMLAGSVLLAYLIKPLVSFFNRPIMLRIPRRLLTSRADWRQPANFVQVRVLGRGLPWVMSIVVVYALLICIIVLIVSFLVPLVAHELRNFLNDGIKVLGEKARVFAQDARIWLMEHLPKEAADAIPNDLSETGAQIGAWAMTSLKGLAPFFGKFVGTVVLLFIVPVLTFYLLVDIDRLRRGFLLLFPSHRRSDVGELIDKVDDVLASYIRGQPYAVLIGIFAGLINLIPYVGTPLGMVPAFLVACFMPTGGLVKGLIVLLCMYCVHITEGKVIVPTVVGKSVGLPPIVILFSLIVGAETLGLPGMLIAVPCTAIVRVIAQHYIARRDSQDGMQPHHFVQSRGA